MNKQVQAQTRETGESGESNRTHQGSAANYAYTVRVRDGVPVETIHQSGCERITGHTLDEFNADPGLWYRIIHEDDRPLAFGMAKLMLADPDNHTLEYRILHKDGSIRWISNTLVPRRTCQDSRLQGNGRPGSSPVFYDGIITDITRRKLEEEELKRRMDNKSNFRQGECHANK